jgi:hypothetical protein
MSNLRITIKKVWGLLGISTQKSTTYQQVINVEKSNTQVLPRIYQSTHSSTQITYMITAFIRTPHTTFAHLHTPNNKE